jgi:hypothetical protein
MCFFVRLISGGRLRQYITHGLPVEPVSQVQRDSTARGLGSESAATKVRAWPKAASLVGAVLQSCCTADYIALTALQCRVLALGAAERLSYTGTQEGQS